MQMKKQSVNSSLFPLSLDVDRTLTFLVLDQSLPQLQGDVGSSVQDDVGDALPAVWRQSFWRTDKVSRCVVDDDLNQSEYTTAWCHTLFHRLHQNSVWGGRLHLEVQSDSPSCPRSLRRPEDLWRHTEPRGPEDRTRQVLVQTLVQISVPALVLIRFVDLVEYLVPRLAADLLSSLLKNVQLPEQTDTDDCYEPEPEHQFLLTESQWPLTCWQWHTQLPAVTGWWSWLGPVQCLLRWWRPLGLWRFLEATWHLQLVQRTWT